MSTKKQGKHDEPKKSAKGVESAETKQLKAEDVVSETLQQQAERQAAIESEKKAEETKNRVVESTKIKTHTKESFAILIAIYKKENPIKYAQKEDRLKATLAAL